MSFYERRILPGLINFAMRSHELDSYRKRLVSGASGRVLEIGIGSGLNLPFYDGDVEALYGLEPSLELLHMTRRRCGSVRFPVLLLAASAEAIPLADGSIDTVVMSWTLCSIPDPVGALGEMRRVLRPGGSLLFVEHGLAPEKRIAAWQHRLTPAWSRIGGGCHLDRKMDRLIADAGFELPDLRRGYMNRLKPFTFMYEGRARPA